MSLLISSSSYIKRPDTTSTIVSICAYVAFLFATEHFSRAVLEKIGPFVHVLFDKDHEHNRKVVARHLGVDLVACASVSVIGVRSRKYLSQIRARFWDSKATFRKSYDRRMWTYIPEAHQCLLIFTAYQVKNLYDSFVWDDGLEFIIHHVLAGTAAWGSMYPGCGHTYALFYMGISEISTSVLVILANFDDVHGVKGLADAFPTLKIACAVAFVVAFITCRIVMWPWVSKLYIEDTMAAMKNTDDKKMKERKRWLVGFAIILGSLTVLQFIWLGQIILMGKEEIEKML
ncbi:hypothetical protein TrCOL_g4350 [Triparma columacea]|uniref:TLC domain-containing protein n=1 Tax=Triparma columacea TaxID=722753 RepID=A0A9W7GDJ5_9STRA|nr:hypothetical protein TrCOL_g4350 [Triparma columacea]